MRALAFLATLLPLACAAPQTVSVALGSSPETVEAALGKPARRYVRKTPQGDLEVWSWIMNDPRGEPQPVHYFANLEAWPPPFWHFGVETTRLAFQDGKLVSIDRLHDWNGSYGRRHPEPVRAGFSKDEVRRALGEPTRTYERQTAEASYDVWAYIVDDPREAPIVGKRIGFEGGVFIEPDYYFGVEYLRVLFQGGKVVALEKPDLNLVRR